MDKVREQTETPDELRERLGAAAYAVTQEAATEAPFSGKYVAVAADGTYTCVVCSAELFQATEQFDAGCGWPSFTGPAHKAGVTEHPDFELGYERTEIRCASCGAHLGHVFPDGPGPGGLRYCINSCALSLEPEAGAAGQA